MRYFVILILTAAPAFAETPMTAEEFDARVTGRTLSFGAPGNPNFGVEMYLPDNRVLWSRGDGNCTQGEWFAQDGDICFRYENDPEDKCWAIYDEPGGIRAIFTTRPNTTVIFEADEGSTPLICNNLSS